MEEGTHEELMARRGVYYRLVQRQGMDRERETMEAEDSRPTDLSWLAGKSMRLVYSTEDRLDLVLSGERVYEAVDVRRAFPLSDPEHYIGFVDREGEAIGVLAELGDLETASRRVLIEALDRRYACPSIVRIQEIRDEGGPVRWQVDTDRGRRERVIEHPRESIAEVASDRLWVVDREGNRFALCPAALDRRSRRKLRASGTASHAVLGFGFYTP